MSERPPGEPTICPYGCKRTVPWPGWHCNMPDCGNPEWRRKEGPAPEPREDIKALRAIAREMWFYAERVGRHLEQHPMPMLGVIPKKKRRAR